MNPSPSDTTVCPCGATSTFDSCCGRYLAGEAAPTAEALMRSRYTAFTLLNEAYLLSSWHSSTRPASLDLHASPQPKWLGLKIVAHHIQDESHATVEFVARSKLAGRAQRLHEVSRFVREDGHWFYVDGEIRSR
ncbi:MAG: YchJ family metal-binding protein [Pseudomonadota bacterium]